MTGIAHAAGPAQQVLSWKETLVKLVEECYRGEVAVSRKTLASR